VIPVELPVAPVAPVTPVTPTPVAPVEPVGPVVPVAPIAELKMPVPSLDERQSSYAVIELGPAVSL
jgi:hypothetical protein